RGLGQGEPPVLREEVAEALPEHEVHGEERDASVRLERPERAHDGGMADAREQLALALESLDALGLDRRRKDLQGDAAREARRGLLLGEPHLAHAAAADQAERGEAREARAGLDPGAHDGNPYFLILA